MPAVDKEERARALVFLQTVSIALALSTLAALTAAASDLWELAALNVIDALVSAATLHVFARQRERAVRAFLWCFTLVLPLGSLTTTPMELTTLGYLFLIPLIAATMLPAEEVRRWFLRTMVLGSGAAIAGHFGLVVDAVDPLPLVTRVLNFVSTLGASLALLHALARERDRSLEHLREAERAKSAFFANVGHEIRTPMNGVLGMTDALLARPLGPVEHEMARTIRSSGDVLLGLLDDLLDLSKLEAGKLQLEPSVVELRPLAAELEALWTPLAARKQLALSVTVAPELPAAARLDGRRLRQVLGNLLNNALKFTERGGVEVSFSTRDGQLCCAVQDTGIGITAEQLERLFGRFVQADDARARRYQGSGLGLSLSRELVHLMGGTVEVSSTPGLGSRFACFVPLEPAEPTPAPSPTTAGALPPSLRVLVVDDNPVNRLVAQRLLDKCGCVVETVSDGPTALEAVAQRAFDVVLMDVQMPEMDGLETTRRIRAQGVDTRIIGVSASAANEDVDGCRRAGMNDFLAKPVTHERLVATLLRNV